MKLNRRKGSKMKESKRISVFSVSTIFEEPQKQSKCYFVTDKSDRGVIYPPWFPIIYPPLPGLVQVE
jgi:hypothetical protein